MVKLTDEQAVRLQQDIENHMQGKTCKTHEECIQYHKDFCIAWVKQETGEDITTLEGLPISLPVGY